MNEQELLQQEVPQHARRTAARLFAQLKGQRVRLAIVVVSIVCYVALSIWNPMYSAIVVDRLWESLQAAWAAGAPFSITWDHLGAELVQLTAQYLFTWLFYYFQVFLMASVAESLVLSLRTQVARKLHRLPLRFFDQNKAGEILSRVTSDLDKISETLQTGLLKMVVAIGTTIGSLAVMFYYSLPLTAIFLVFMGISMLITRSVARRNLACAAQRQETVGNLTGIVEEYYNGRNVIRAYNHEAESIQQVVEAAERNRIANQKADFLTNCVNPLIRLLTRFSQVFIAIVAGQAMLSGTMTVGVVQAFFQYVGQTAEPLTEASYMINALQSALASAERTFQLLDEEEERPDPAHPAQLDHPRGGGLPPRPVRLHPRSPADEGHQLHRPARAEDRRGGQHRRRKDHPHQPAHAFLRDRRRGHHRGRGGHRRNVPGRPAEELRHGPPGHLALRGDGGGEHRLWQTRRHPGGDRGRGQGGQGGLLHPHHAPGV